MHSILDWFRDEGIIFKGGSGSGVNVSRIRSQKENLSGGGFASGPVVSVHLSFCCWALRGSASPT